jgi:hypothetical protein
MARASTITKLSLDRWAQIIGLDSRYFNQVVITQKPVNTCDKVWKQYAWQENDQVSREDVAIAIQQAEETIERYLGYHLLPSWDADEKIGTPQPGDRSLFYRQNINPRGFPLHVQTQWGHYISGGMQAKTLIEAAAAVVYSDADGDGYKETATITCATTLTDAEEIAVYFAGESGADQWEIRPIKSISFAGGNVIIVLQRHQLVDPIYWEALDPQAVDGDDDLNFVDEVDVYRKWNNPSQQVQLIWSPRPGYCTCGEATCVNCQNSYQYGCLNAKDERLGLVHYQPGVWNTTTEQFDNACLAVERNPDKLRLWYRSGLRDTRQTYPDWQMEPTLERAVAFYALTLLERPICGCNNLEKVVGKWTEEINLNLPTASYQINDRWLDNPLGVTRAAVFAWEAINQPGRLIGRAVRY